MKDGTFCALCNAEATKLIPDSMTALCRSHADAYTWGQNSIDDAAIPENRQLITYEPPTLDMFDPEFTRLVYKAAGAK